ncbi:SRPBCC family protein [Acuticoccus kandeliae]|uniref:SRPBCC family protein n=1 Tax=Acuticoccus kandeliae TaxID=2073160 RepID=UPI000D3E5F32|nr:SRPBCC domain-containing protein [Acuticoccus kandeliae]
MSDTKSDVRTVTIERDFPYPAAKIWRALTEPHLLSEWLMKSDFAPVVGHHFQFSADWGSVDCTVEIVEPNVTLAYTWNAYGLESVVTWTLTETADGTRLRMEQTGFRPDQEQAFQGAKAGWPRFLANLERVLAETA